jgi:outer membrane protein assembly factor BamB
VTKLLSRGFLTKKLKSAVVILFSLLLIQFYGVPAFPVSTNSSTDSTIFATQLWNFTTDGSVYTSPIIADGCIYALCSFEYGGSTCIYCINASTGTQIWNFPIKSYVYSALAVSGGYVYTGSGHGKAYALNASTGAQIWNFTSGNPVSSPTVAGGYVYMRSSGNLYALDSETGDRIWDSADGSWVGLPPTVADGVVYIGSVNGNIRALYAATGAQKWNYQVESDLYSLPVVAGGHIYVVPDNGNVYCLDAHTGARIWNYSTGRSWNFGVWTPSIIGGFAGFPVAVGGYAYLGSDDGVLHALNDSTGIEIWNYTTGGVVGSPTVANGYLYVGSNSGNNGNFYVLNASTGAKIWNYTTENIAGPPTLTGPTETTAAPPVVSGSVVYFGSGRPVEAWGDIRGVNGTVHAFDALTGAQVWNYTIGYPMGYILVGSDMIYAVSAGGFGKSIDNAIGSTIYALETKTVTSPTLTIAVITGVVVIVVVAVVFTVYRTKRKGADKFAAQHVVSKP